MLTQYKSLILLSLLSNTWPVFPQHALDHYKTLDVYDNFKILTLYESSSAKSVPFSSPSIRPAFRNLLTSTFTPMS